MARDGHCPICDYALDDHAVTVVVGGARHRVCCDDCAREAAAIPARLPAGASAGKGR